MPIGLKKFDKIFMDIMNVRIVENQFKVWTKSHCISICNQAKESVLALDIYLIRVIICLLLISKQRLTRYIAAFVWVCNLKFILIFSPWQNHGHCLLNKLIISLWLYSVSYHCCISGSCLILRTCRCMRIRKRISKVRI